MYYSVIFLSRAVKDSEADREPRKSLIASMTMPAASMESKVGMEVNLIKPKPRAAVGVAR
jgi:hypothetical protein